MLRLVLLYFRSSTIYCHFIRVIRIKQPPSGFIKSLRKEIVDEKYKFSDEKLTEMADSLATRMNKENAEKFSDLLNQHYHK